MPLFWKAHIAIDFTLVHMEDNPFEGTLRDGAYSAGAEVGTYKIQVEESR